MAHHTFSQLVDIPRPPAFGGASIRTTERLQFHGTGSEYFGIWIVNLLLTIVTFGIYSAWAKVRRLRYFYGNTLLQNHSFDYHANPLRILLGRIIALGVLFIVNILSGIDPWYALLLLPYLVALPWILNQSMAFNAQMTSYRNIRFSFRGNYFPALGVLLVMPLLSLVSLGLLAPVSSLLRANYIGQRLRFGTSRFSTRLKLSPLYANLGVSVGFLALVSVAVFAALFPMLLTTLPGGSDDRSVTAIIMSGIPAVYVSLFVTYHIYRAGVRNVAFNGTMLEGGHELSSHLSRRRYAWILVSNLVLTVLTLGFFWPWAEVRLWRYLAESTVFHPAGSLEHFVDQATPRGSAAAAEYLDLGGLDFGL